MANRHYQSVNRIKITRLSTIYFESKSYNISYQKTDHAKINSKCTPRNKSQKHPSQKKNDRRKNPRTHNVPIETPSSNDNN